MNKQIMVMTCLGVFAAFAVEPCPLLVPDYNRDGKINQDDYKRLEKGEAFTIWLNDDDDAEGTGGGEDPGDTNNDLHDVPGGEGNDRDCEDEQVNGRCDLLDFFPVLIDMNGVEDWQNYAWRLVSKSVNVVFTQLKADTAGDFHTKEAKALDDETPLYKAGVEQLAGDEGKEEVTLPADFLKNGRGVFIVEGAALGDEGLTLRGEQEGGDPIEVTLKLRVKNVEDMYRWMNLRPESKDGNSTVQPSTFNLQPDSRHFILVHGYNTNHEEARGNAAEFYKKLFQSGSDAMLTAVEWRGDQSQIKFDLLGVNFSPNYHVNVENAFAAARPFADACKKLPGEKILVAHSLGNVLVSSAIKDYGLDYTKYVMLNAAVPREAYDANVYDEDMVDEDWQDATVRPFVERASQWYKNFAGKEYDPYEYRRKLAWRGRFANLPRTVNYYSPTDNILLNPDPNEPDPDKVFQRNDPEIYSKVHALLLAKLVNGRSIGRGGSKKTGFGFWSFSEKMKGTWLLDTINDVLTNELLKVSQADAYKREGGWGENIEYDDDPKKPFDPANTRFTPFLDARMKTKGMLDILPAETERLRAQHLADAIPAESFAAGANPVATLANVNEEDFIGENPDWPVFVGDEVHTNEWNHSAFREVAFYHTSKFYASLAAVGKPRVIIDTDLGSSMDDLFTIDLAARMHKAGKLDLMAVMMDRPDYSDDVAFKGEFLAFADRYLASLGLGDLPIGKAEGQSKLGHTIFNPYWTLIYSNNLTGVGLLLPTNRTPEQISALTNAVALYRQLLEGAPDKSVVICSTGFLTNLRALMDSDSDLNLIAKKVKELRIMGGCFDYTDAPDGTGGAEYNFAGDPEAAKKVVEEWPTPVILSPWEVGLKLEYKPKDVLADFPAGTFDPVVRSAYTYWPEPLDEKHRNRLWDPMTVLPLTEGDMLVPLSELGGISVDGKGKTTFEPDASSNRCYQVSSNMNATAVMNRIRAICRTGNPSVSVVPISPAEPGVDYNGSVMSIELDGVNLGRYSIEDLRASLTVAGEVYTPDPDSIRYDALGEVLTFTITVPPDKVTAGNAYDGEVSVFLVNDTLGENVLYKRTRKLVQGRQEQAEPMTDWFNETDLKAPTNYVPATAMPERCLARVETAFIFEAPVEATDESPQTNAVQSAVRVVEDGADGYKFQYYACVGKTNEGFFVRGWWDFNFSGEGAQEIKPVLDKQYTVRVEAHYLEDARREENTLVISVMEEGSNQGFVKQFIGNIINAKGEQGGTTRLNSVEFVGDGEIPSLVGNYYTNIVNATLARVDGTEYATVAEAVAAADGQPVRLLHAASWKPTTADIGKPVKFLNKGDLVLDLSDLPLGARGVWSEVDGNNGTLTLVAGLPVGVCSWTWHSSMTNVLAQMAADGRYNGMQLALAPWLGIDNTGTYFGEQEGKEVWDFIRRKIASGELNVMATMINFPKEDYTTLASITNTQGYMYGVKEEWPDADEQWASNLFYTAEAARLTKELGVKTLTTESGFICIDQDLMYDRVSNVCEVCKSYGVDFLIESGPQHSQYMTNLLTRLNAAGITNVGVNFDPGDTELFEAEDPVESYQAMKKWVKQIHVKDCMRKGVGGRYAWNEDCPWGEGVVSRLDFGGCRTFLNAVKEDFFPDGINILYERLSSDPTLMSDRAKEVKLAMDRIIDQMTNTEGSVGNPWSVGAERGTILACTNGEALVLSGHGGTRDFNGSAAPWGTGVTAAEFGAQVTNIGANAFADCTLTNLSMRGNPPAIGEGNVFSEAEVHVRADALAKFEAADGWKNLNISATLPIPYDCKKGVKTLAPFLHEIWFTEEYDSPTDKPYTALPDVMPGFSCTSVRNGNFYGRNMDYFLSDISSFVVHVPAKYGPDSQKIRLASVGVASQNAIREDDVTNGLYTASYDTLPEIMYDGINECGVIINNNVVPRYDCGTLTGTNPEGEPLHVIYLIRYVLDHATNALHAVELIKSRDLVGMAGPQYQLHWMVADPQNNTYVVEVITNAVVARKMDINSNFNWNWDNENKCAIDDDYVKSGKSTNDWGRAAYPVPYSNDVSLARIDAYYSPHADGVERFCIVNEHYDEGATFEGMFSLMQRVQYTKLGDRNNKPIWLSDFNGDIDSSITNMYGLYRSGDTNLANYLDIAFKLSKEVFANKEKYRKANSGEWQTVHNTTYDFEKRMFRIAVQEDYEHTFDIWLAQFVNVSLPAGVQGFSYVVSNLTEGVAIETSGSLPGSATYDLPIGAKVGIYCVPAEDYVVTGTNPYVIEKVTGETTLKGVTLPTAVKPVCADTVVYGTIRTAEKGNSVAEAIAIKDGKFVYVGDEAGVAAFIETGVTEIIDHRGKGMVMPGCTDGHSHYTMKFGLANMKGGILFDMADDKTNVLKKVEEAALTAQAAGKTCIFGFGWNLVALRLKDPPTLEELDNASHGLSMVIFAQGGHHAYCNSECLKRCKILSEDGKTVLIKEIPGGLLELDENDYPTGFVDERVTGYLTRMGGINPDELVDDAVAETSIRASQDLLLSTGYTIALEGWSNTLHPSNFYVAAHRMDTNGTLKLVFPMTYEVEPWQTDEAISNEIKRLDSLNKTYGTEHVRPEYLKVFMDGCVESMTGAMIKPYKDGTEYKSFWSTNRLADITRECNAKGLTVHTHVMGDAAIRDVTDAYIQGGDGTHRNCMVHLRHVRQEDFQRFADNNIACSAGFTWHVSSKEMDNLLKNFLDEEYIKHAYPMKSFFAAGAKVSSHSDFPANEPSPQDPFGIMQVALTGLLPDSSEEAFDTNELVTVEQVFQALTLNGAWQMGLENERGSIAVGKWADFVLADQDVFECEVTNIAKTTVVSTWFEGEKVYQAPDGSEENPWLIGATTNDTVTAWTNGTDCLVIAGRGAMKGFGTVGPWGTGIASAEFGAQVTNVGANAFSGCEVLKALTMRGNPPMIGSGNDFSGVTLTVRADAKAKFEAADGWKDCAIGTVIPVCYDYEHMKTLTPFLHEVWYDDYVFDKDGETLSKDMVFSCSAVRNGNFIGRNFDFFLNDTPEFVVHVAANPLKGRLASVGMAMHSGMREDGVTNGEYTASYDIIPNRTVDGINEKGVAINQNVVAYDPEVVAGAGKEFTGTNPGAPDLNISFVTRLVLDNATNAAHGVELIKSHNLFGMSVSGDILHYMISDSNETFVVEIVTNTVVARHFKMMTNFNVNWDNGNARALTDADKEVWTKDDYPEPSNLVVTAGNFDAATNSLAKYYALHAEGVERFIRLRDNYDEGATFDGMVSLMQRAQYSQASTFDTQPYWYSDRCSVALDKALVEVGFPALANTYVLYGLKYYPSKTGMVGFSLDAFLERELMADERTYLADKDRYRKADTGVWLTVHNTTYDIEKRMFRVAVQEDYKHTFDIHLGSEPVTPGTPLGPYDTAEEATNVAKKAVLAPRADVSVALGSGEAREIYCNMFAFDVVPAAGGKWAVEAFLLPEPWSNVVESAQVATLQIPIADIAALPSYTATNVTVKDCGVPGFYYSFYSGSTVTNMRAIAADAGRNVLCGADKKMEFDGVSKPSDAAGFFSIGVLEVPTIIPGDNCCITGKPPHFPSR